MVMMQGLYYNIRKKVVVSIWSRWDKFGFGRRSETSAKTVRISLKWLKKHICLIVKV